MNRLLRLENAQDLIFTEINHLFQALSNSVISFLPFMTYRRTSPFRCEIDSSILFVFLQSMKKFFLPNWPELTLNG